MAAPLTLEQRESVLTTARTGASRNEVARITGVSASSVSRICTKAGLTFDRTTTAAAVEARTTDLRAARTTEATSAITAAAQMRHEALQADSARDARDYATAYGKFITAHVALQRHDSDEHSNLADVDIWMNMMIPGGAPQ